MAGGEEQGLRARVDAQFMFVPDERLAWTAYAHSDPDVSPSCVFREVTRAFAAVQSTMSRTAGMRRPEVLPGPKQTMTV